MNFVNLEFLSICLILPHIRDLVFLRIVLPDEAGIDPSAFQWGLWPTNEISKHRTIYRTPKSPRDVRRTLIAPHWRPIKLVDAPKVSFCGVEWPASALRRNLDTNLFHDRVAVGPSFPDDAPAN